MNLDALRAQDERDYQAYRATLAASARAELDAAQALMEEAGRAATPPAPGYAGGGRWWAHPVRHRLGATDHDTWFLAVLALERHGDVRVSLFASPGPGAEGEARWQQWQDQPLETWGERYMTSRGVRALATRYGDPVTPPAWLCDECVCSCGRQSQTPLGGFCVLCRLECDL
jgi:hypothetical protein